LPIADAGSSWDARGTRSSGAGLFRIGMTTDLSDLAHEIKNPLGGICGAAQLLEHEFNNPALKELIGGIEIAGYVG
jgi:nitrogen-specific signal transduction histidine kinase